MIFAIARVKNAIIATSMIDETEKFLKSIKDASKNFKVEVKYKTFKVLLRDTQGNWLGLLPNLETIELNTKNYENALKWNPKKEQYWLNV